MDQSSNPSSAPKSKRPLWLKIVFVLACLVTLLAAIYTIENWRGTHKWQAYKQQLEAQGERLDLSSLVPPTIPDDQNFASHPLIGKLFAPSKASASPLGAYPAPQLPAPAAPDVEHEKNGDGPTRKKNDPRSFLELWSDYYLNHSQFPQASAGAAPALVVKTALSKHDADIAELKAAMIARPQCRFPLKYQEGIGIHLEHLAPLKQLTVTLRLRAVADLHLGEAAAAFDEVKLGFFLADTLKQDPLLISQLTRMAMDQIMLEAVREGLELRRWNDAHLAWFASYLGRRDYMGDYCACMRGERNFCLLAAEMLRQGRTRELISDDLSMSGTESAAANAMPSGWVCQNMYHLAWFFQEYALHAVDVKQRRVLKPKVDEFEPAIKNAGFLPYTILVKLLVPALSKSALNFGRWQSLGDCTVIACALERHRLATGKLPEKLEGLVPTYLPALPLDVVTGQPLVFRIGTPDQYRVYSCGWNQKDDGGANTPRKEDGDWGVEVKAPGR